MNIEHDAFKKAEEFHAKAINIVEESNDDTQLAIIYVTKHMEYIKYKHLNDTLLEHLRPDFYKHIRKQFPEANLKELDKIAFLNGLYKYEIYASIGLIIYFLLTFILTFFINKLVDVVYISFFSSAGLLLFTYFPIFFNWIDESKTRYSYRLNKGNKQ